MLLLTLTACDLVAPFLYEVREPEEEITLQGWVYSSPIPETDDDVVTDGVLEFIVQDESDSVEGEQPFDSYPGYWRATLPAGAAYELRIDGGEGWYPAVWKGLAPAGSGYWSGIFGFDSAVVDPFFDSFAEAYGIDASGVDGGLVHVWGRPLDPDAVSGDAISITDETGAPVGVLAFVVNDEGVLEETREAPVDYFFAFNLPPGAVEIFIDSDGGGATETWYAEGGDIVAAFYFGVP